MNGILLMLAADVAFAAMAAATKYTGHSLSASQIVFIRSAVSTLILYVVMSLRHKSIQPAEPGLLWARGIIGYIALQCYFWALPQLTLGTGVMLNYTAPIFAVILSLLILKEKPPIVVIVSLFFSFLGVYFLASPEMPGKPLAIFAGLLSGILAGFVHVLIREGNKTDPPFRIIFYFTLASTIGSGLLLLKSGWVSPSANEWFGLAAITVSSLLGQLFLTYSLQKAPVWVVSPFGYLTPVLGLLLGSIFWQEKMTPTSLLGSCIIICCGSLMLRLFKKIK